MSGTSPNPFAVGAALVVVAIVLMVTLGSEGCDTRPSAVATEATGGPE